MADSEGDYDYGPRALASAVVESLSIEEVKEDLKELGEDGLHPAPLRLVHRPGGIYPCIVACTLLPRA